MKIRLMMDGAGLRLVEQVGVFSPKPRAGRLAGRRARWASSIAGIKTVTDAQIGDTVTEAARPTAEPFPGFHEMKPMVFAGLYPGREP